MRYFPIAVVATSGRLMPDCAWTAARTVRRRRSPVVLTRPYAFLLAYLRLKRLAVRVQETESDMSQAFASTTGLSPFDNVLVTRLLAQALALFDNDKSTARIHVQRAYFAACGEPASAQGKGLLADWQVRRVEEFIETHMETSLRIGEAARRVRLSSSHFSRAFKASKGIAYSDFVTRQRITRAKEMLLTTEVTIAEIAVACGFADQPHLTRLFRQIVGLTPRAWRRQQREPEVEVALAA